MTADSLVLGHAAATVVAAHGLDVAAAVLVAAVVPALLSLSKAMRTLLVFSVIGISRCVAPVWRAFPC